MAELLEERGQSMAEQVASVDTLLRQDPVRQDPSRHRELIRRLSFAGQAPLAEVEELTSTEASTQRHQESRRAAWRASVRRLLLVAGLAVHARPEAGQGMSEAEEESDDGQESNGSDENAVGELMPTAAGGGLDDDGDGKDEAEHEESKLMLTAAGPRGGLAEEEDNDDSEQPDPDAIVRQYLQHQVEAGRRDA